ncbi:MAG TPA: hypothetical protein VFW28_03030 [Micropepsaceae bacterium]|nr:hypothetical protein [Micropepsaceae bacterium]
MNMAKKSNTAHAGSAALSRLKDLFHRRAMRLRLSAQEKYGEESVDNLMEVARKGAVTAAIAMVNHTIGTPLALPAAAANAQEDAIVAAIERRGDQLLEKLDPPEADGAPEISEESD